MAGEDPAQSHSAAHGSRAARPGVWPWPLQAGLQPCCAAEETPPILQAWDRFQHLPDDQLSENRPIFSLTRLDIPWRGFCFPFSLEKRKIGKHLGTKCPVSLERAWAGCLGGAGSAMRSLPAPSLAEPPVTTWAHPPAQSSVQGPKRGFLLSLWN